MMRLVYRIVLYNHSIVPDVIQFGKGPRYATRMTFPTNNDKYRIHEKVKICNRNLLMSFLSPEHFYLEAPIIVLVEAKILT